MLGFSLRVADSNDVPDAVLLVGTCAWCEQIRLVEGRDRPIDRLAKNVLLFGQQDEGEVDVSGCKIPKLENHVLAVFAVVMK